MEIKNLSFGYKENEKLINNLTLDFKKGHITSIIGPNGSGKSTLLMILARILKDYDGSVSLNDRNILKFSIKDYAKQVAVVHQRNQVYNDLDVKTIVGYGRLPYANYFQRFSKEDFEIIEEAIKITSLEELRDRELRTLSGGQQQRVWIAMALAQKTPIILLDEPTTYLDIKYQIEILNLVRYINDSSKTTIVMVHHDINQAIQYSHEIIGLKNGNVIFNGKPKDVISSESLKELYDYDLDVITKDDKHIVLNYK